MKGMIEIREYSSLFNTFYDICDVVFISNMTQNYFYVENHREYKDDLADIITKNERIYFVWKKSNEIKALYREWCQKGLNKENNEK